MMSEHDLAREIPIFVVEVGHRESNNLISHIGTDAN